MKQDDSCGKKERTARKVSAARKRAAEKKKSMEVRILAIGDVVGEKGLAFVQRHLRPLKKEKNVDFVVVNGENAAGGLGLLPDQADGLFAAGADVITLGNHSYDKRQIVPLLEDSRYLLRPANYTARAPGRGTALYDCGRYSIRVISLQGRVSLNYNCDNPFTVADRILKQEEKATFTLVDFHAEATSEKLAMGYYLDGRVSALWGTHTHVQTADAQILPKGTGYLTDAGMSGPVCSVLGMPPEESIEGFLGGLRGRSRVADGPCALRGVLFTLERESGLCTGVERIDVR